MKKFRGDLVDIKQSENENKNIQKDEKSFIDLQNNIKYYDMYIMSIRRPRRRETQKNIQKNNISDLDEKH